MKTSTKISTKTNKTFSLEKEVLRQIERTRGSASASERVNSLIRTGLEAERRMALDREAAKFFSDDVSDIFEPVEERGHRRGFQSATLKPLARE